MNYPQLFSNLVDNSSHKLSLLISYSNLSKLTFDTNICLGISSLFLLDVIACVSPLGIFFGRISNFINGELVGKTTNAFWGVIFPAIDMLPRHPSQLYEAFLEGIVLYFILNAFIFKKNYKTGTCASLFLIFYGIFRIFSELFREPDPQIGYLFNLFSMGTFLSFLMILFGILLFFKFVKKNEI